MALLLDLDTPRSDRDPEAAAAAPDGSFARHPLTGAFTKPAVESALNVRAFRDAFPLHATLLATVVVIELNLVQQFLHASAFASSDSPAVGRAFAVLYPSLSIIALIGRLRLHLMQDQVRSQRLGSGLWTATVLLYTVADVIAFVADADRTCTAVRTKGVYVWPFLDIMIALVNGSHGMGFLHKTGLMVIVLIGDTLMLRYCCGVDLALSCAGALVVGYVTAHLAELHIRRAFAEKRLEQERREQAETRQQQAEARQHQAETRQEQLQAAKERLQYDFNMAASSCCPTPADDNRSDLRRDLQPGGAAGPSGLPPPRPPSPGCSFSSYSSDGYWDRRPSQRVLRDDPTARAEHRDSELLRDARRCGPKVWAVLRLLLLGMSREGSSPFQVLDIELVRQIMYHIIVTRLNLVRSSEVALVPGSPWHAMLEWVRPTLLRPPPARVPPAAWTPMPLDDPEFSLPSPPPQAAAPPRPLPAVEAPPRPAADEEEQGEESEEEDDEKQVPGLPGAVFPLFRGEGRGRGRGRGRGHGGQRGGRGGHDADGGGTQD